MLRNGTVLKKRYQIIETIDHSDNANTYLAKDLHEDALCAVKAIETVSGTEEPDFTDSTVRIAEKLREDDHPAFPHIIDVFEQKQTLYLVREYIEGQTLEQLVREEGPQPEQKVLGWALQLCDAISYLHNFPSPIIYRELNPSRIILKPDGDLVIINYDPGQQRSQKGNIAATEKNGFMAPEQYFGQFTEGSDIYSLGATLRFVLTGIDPDENPDASYDEAYAQRRISKKMISIIDRCTAYFTNERFLRCEELRSALTDKHALLNEEQIEKRHFAVRVVLGVLIGVLLIGAIVGAFFLFKNNTTKAVATPDETHVQLTTVPNVVGKTIEDAQKKLDLSGLICDRRDVYNNTVPAGVVYAQKPQANTTLEKDTVIIVAVSLGPQPATEPPPPPTEEETQAAAPADNDYVSYNYSDD